MANNIEIKSQRDNGTENDTTVCENNNIPETLKNSTENGSNKNTPKRPRKLTLSEFLGEGSFVKKEEKRNYAFEKLNDKKELAKRLKNSAPCRHIINKGKCIITHCTFAHSMEELTPPLCIFEEGCKKLSCNSIHPSESRNDWIKKMGYIDIFQNKLYVLPRPEHSLEKKEKENNNRWDQDFSNVSKNEKTNSHSRNDSLSDVTFSPRDKVIIIFPERFSDRKIKKVFDTLVDIEISNIEIRRVE
jgi:hypothetical protein